MKASQSEQFKLSETAALWVIRLDGDAGEACRAEFFEWVRQSPKHMEEFMFAKAVSERLKGLDPDRKVEIHMSVLETLRHDTLVTIEGAAAAPVAAERKRRGWRTFPMTLAASVLIALTGAILLAVLSDTEVFTTDTGDQQSVKLSDGSLMLLNAHSRAQVQFSDTVRQVHLLEGEALFTAARDPVRPFEVHAGATRIRAIGTQFNVYRRPAATRVSVIEGVVLISNAPVGAPSDARAPLRLEAGAEAEISAGRVLKESRPDIERAVAWRARRLVFHSDRLQDVVREFNRYNRDPIRLDTPEIGERRISGVFDADDTGPLVEFLKAHPDFSVMQKDREIVIRGH